MIETENQLGSRAGSGLGQYEEAAATITNGNGGGGNGTDGKGDSTAAAEVTTLEDAGEESSREIVIDLLFTLPSGSCQLASWIEFQIDVL